MRVEGAVQASTGNTRRSQQHEGRRPLRRDPRATQISCLALPCSIPLQRSCPAFTSQPHNHSSETMTGSGQEIIQRALDELKTNVNSEDGRAFENSTAQGVWDLAREIEREQNAKRRLQNMRRVEPVLRLLESYAGVMDTVCQGFSPMAWVLGVHIPFERSDV